MNPKAISKAKKLVKGLILEWQDANPTEEAVIEKPKISHKNPVLRLAASQMLADYSNYIFKRLRFKWRVTVTLFFKYPNRDKYEEEVVLDADCYLADLNDLCLSEIKTELRRHHEKAFYNSKFFIECVGV
jgi:hypothetical protein